MQTKVDGLREQDRLAALHSYRVLDTPSEREFDDLTNLAAQICETPIALVSLVDAERQWFKARVGLDAVETPREIAFCHHAIRQPRTMVVPDATADERFADNVLVREAPGIRFYAGAPLIDDSGYALGTLCVIDRRARELSARQQESLERLSRHVVKLLELRRSNRTLADCLERVTGIARLVPVCGHCHQVRNDADEWQRIEQYFRDLTGAEFTHGVCPACLVTHYTDQLDQLELRCR